MYNIKLLNKISKVGLDGFDENYAYSEETVSYTHLDVYKRQI